MSTTESAAARVWTVPNAISAARLALVPLFAWLAFNGYDVAAVAVVMVSGLSDWLDGVLARRLNQRSRLGELLDPAADRLFIAVTILVLALRGAVPWWLVALLVGREVLLVLVLAVLMARGHGPLPVHFVGKAGTLALLYAFPLLLLAQFDGSIGPVASVVGWAFAWWGAGLYWFAAGLYVRQASHVISGRAA